VTNLAQMSNGLSANVQLQSAGVVSARQAETGSASFYADGRERVHIPSVVMMFWVRPGKEYLLDIPLESKRHAYTLQIWATHGSYEKTFEDTDRVTVVLSATNTFDGKCMVMLFGRITDVFPWYWYSCQLTEL
jgi:hypothetical protein